MQDPHDLVGLIAYSLYKRQKLDFVDAHQSEHGCKPTADELRVFYQLVNMPDQIEALRTRSATLLEQVSEVVLEEALQEMQKDFQARLLSELKTPKNFWRAVGENVLANLVAAGLVTLALVMFYLSQVEVVPAVGNALGYEVTPKPQK
ncbi:hypothetical protein [Polaromonas sp.]|uniref:hypothetical protein n=1 Tax=Polaromonas sp. TaxID=1869339 RepID=UPI0037508203